MVLWLSLSAQHPLSQHRDHSGVGQVGGEVDAAAWIHHGGAAHGVEKRLNSALITVGGGIAIDV